MDIYSITIQSLKEFLKLAEIRNYAAAADELFISQATLSRHIMHLEEQLGSPLFNRTTRSVELNSFGIKFLPFAKDIVDSVDSCVAELFEKTTTNDNNTIRFGVFTPFFYNTDSNEALKLFFNQHPGYVLDLKQGQETDLLEMLEDNTLDVVMLREPSNKKDQFKRIKLTSDEPICLLVPSNSEYADVERIRLEQLKNETFIVPPTLASPYRMFLENCQKSGFNPKLRSGLAKDSTLEMVKNHQGLLVRTHLNHADINYSDVKVIIPEPEMYFSTNLVFRKLALHSKAIGEFINYVKKYYENH